MTRQCDQAGRETGVTLSAAGSGGHGAGVSPEPAEGQPHQCLGLRLLVSRRSKGQFLLSKHPVCGTWSWQPQETDTGAVGGARECTSFEKHLGILMEVRTSLCWSPAGLRGGAVRFLLFDLPPVRDGTWRFGRPLAALSVEGYTFHS